jgi:6-pyruvoyltetrahydropterin/6-carboxytetrahydropterin synthase
MYELRVSFGFGAAHRLEEYGGKCENLHGHNWKVEIEVTAGELDSRGLAIDFRELKTLAREVIDKLDHTFLNENPLLKGLNPSSENIARRIFEELKQPLAGRGVKLSRVTAWESEDACAAYMED